ncbi:zinc-finger-containing protein [Sphingopyxis sp. 550A]
MSGPTCLECGGVASLTDGRTIYPHRHDLYSKPFWLCECGAYCGCHRGTTAALGSPCGPVTRAARSLAHAAFDPLWRTKQMTRPEAYSWLSKATGIPRERCHMGMMTAAEAKLVVDAVRARATPNTPDMEKVK